MVVLNMLRRLHKDVPADYSACVFDAKGKTFRDDWYPQYKATRTAMPDELGSQVQPLHECIRALGWPLLEVEGVEADDVIGTLAVQADQSDVRVVISSSDKDLTQLVGPRVTMVNTMSNETFDEAGVQAKFGVTAAQMVDYLTLIGDSVDNIPGVDKVGPKTAPSCSRNMQRSTICSSMRKRLPGWWGRNLRKARDWLPQARRLLTVKCDVPSIFAWSSCIRSLPTSRRWHGCLIASNFALGARSSATMSTWRRARRGFVSTRRCCSRNS
jgi:DNA polymerase-1